MDGRSGAGGGIDAMSKCDVAAQDEFVEPTALSRTLANTETMQLAGIHALDAFYTPIEERFERITRVGRKALRAAVFAISVIVQETQWFKSVRGWNVSELPLKSSLCQGVVTGGKPVMIGDLMRSPHFSTHPLVTQAPAFRYYCGAPLRNSHGTVIGTVCAMGTKPRKFCTGEAETLLDLATLAERELLNISLHTAQAELLSKLSIARRQAMIDPLTKTWNRRGGEKLINQALARMMRTGKGVAVIAVDIDDFKRINDSHGHAAGDSILRMVARELLACTREGDAVCRQGGDEFVMVLTDVTRDVVVGIVDRAMSKIRKNEVALGGGAKATTSVSMGFTITDGGRPVTAEDILKEADAALYESKMSKRLRIVID